MPITLKRNLFEVQPLPGKSQINRLATRLVKGQTTLLDVAHQIQEKYGYLPKHVLEEICYAAKIPKEHLWGFLTFYTNFEHAPPSAVKVRVCKSVSCHLRGAARVLEAAEALVAEIGDKGEAPLVISGVSCLGACDGAPAMMVGKQLYVHLEPAKVSDLLRSLIGKSPAVERLSAAGWSEPQYQTLREYEAAGGYRVFRRVVKDGSPEKIVEEVKASGLRGLGGAGFSAGAKWDFVRKAAGEEKFVVCNADEGEPGTFKDRVIMEQTPHRMLEGMLIAAYAVGAGKGYIYLREEYYRCRAVLERCLKELRRARLLGRNILGSSFSFELYLVSGAGSYVCGEETALLESIEGKRGEPRLKPPFPATHGLWGKPTLINNVETLAYVPCILDRGAGWFRGLGRGDAAGVKLYPLSGQVRRPGCYELPLGITAKELIFEHGGGIPGDRRLKAFVPGGLSTGLLPAEMADVPLDFEHLAKCGSMLGTGAVVALAEGTCMVDFTENALEFFAHESCGKCTPCRAGTEKLLYMVRRIKVGDADRVDYSLIEELAETMGQASICGLGQTAYLPLLHALKFFGTEFEEHLRGRCPEGVCFKG